MKGHSDNIVFVKQDFYYESKLGRTHVIKINNEVVFRELNGEIIKDIRNKVKDETITENFNNIKQDKKLMDIAKKVYSNKRVRRLVVIFGTLMLTYAAYSILPIASVSAAVLEESITASAEYYQVKAFIDYIILIIRVLAGVICSLIIANAGLKTLTDENTDGVKEAKKVANKVLWALFLIFAGTSVAGLITKQLLLGL